MYDYMWEYLCIHMYDCMYNCSCYTTPTNLGGLHEVILSDECFYVSIGNVESWVYTGFIWRGGGVRAFICKVEIAYRWRFVCFRVYF